MILPVPLAQSSHEQALYAVGNLTQGSLCIVLCKEQLDRYSPVSPSNYPVVRINLSRLQSRPPLFAPATCRQLSPNSPRGVGINSPIFLFSYDYLISVQGPPCVSHKVSQPVSHLELRHKHTLFCPRDDEFRPAASLPLPLPLPLPL